MDLLLPRLRQDQSAILLDRAMIKVVAMGRRWGKTLMAGATSIVCANEGAKVGWIVPTYKNSRPIWRFALQLLYTARRSVRISESDRSIEFPGGGSLGVYTADNPVSILGEWFDLVIVEEAARIREDVFSETIMPTLADRDGRAILISTPRGRNWFWREYIRGLSRNADYASFNAPTSANPMPQIQKAYQLARDRVPPRTFAQEWDAQFLTDGTFFQNVDLCCSIEEPDEPGDHDGHTIVMGIDWAKQEDQSIALCFCCECSRAVDWYKARGVSYIDQREKIIALANKWRIAGALPERNSIGEPNIEMLQEADVPIAIGIDGKPGFFTSSSTKARLIERLENELAQKSIRLPKEAAEELAAFEINQRDVGPAKYSAPEGEHDDWVLACAFAVWLASSMIQIF